MRTFILFILGFLPLAAQQYRPTNERPPAFPREFRAAWIATVYNVDWPSRPGLSAQQQQGQLIQMLNTAKRLGINAVIFQVRPNADALYQSNYEPWSQWLSGTMGRHPGYDPLAFCIQQAHARGIEVHAWFNPFRASPNKALPASSNHISRTHPSIVWSYKQYLCMDPASSFTRQRALQVIMDVVKRYDVDGVHIDDYFYPYPTVVNGRPSPDFPDGKTPAQRRSYVDSFVKDMYHSVKQSKPWVRVGISPFGIWRPGVPAGIEAGIDSYDHLAADSKKWLQNGWCDYLAPQLYWRCQPTKQSFPLLLNWWRSQGSRPVWPGVATSRILSSEDAGRPASEITHQIQYTRSIGRNWAGHLHWSMKALMENRGGISDSLRKSTYATPALVPPMPWVNNSTPDAPSQITAQSTGQHTIVRWTPVSRVQRYSVQARYGRKWQSITVTPQPAIQLNGSPDAIAISAIDRYGNSSAPTVVGR